MEVSGEEEEEEGWVARRSKGVEIKKREGRVADLERRYGEDDTNEEDGRREESVGGLSDRGARALNRLRFRFLVSSSIATLTETTGQDALPRAPLATQASNCVFHIHRPLHSSLLQSQAVCRIRYLSIYIYIFILECEHGIYIDTKKTRLFTDPDDGT